MLRRAIQLAAVLLVWTAAGPPAHAALSPPQQIHDVYVLTLDGKVVRLPGGTGAPQEILKLRDADASFEGEAFAFDPHGMKFIAGPGASGAYRSLPMDLSNTGSVIPGLRSFDNMFTLGTFGIAFDLSIPATGGMSDLMLADPNPNALASGVGNGVIRVKGNGAKSLAASLGPTGYDFPIDVDVNNANGDIFVVASKLTPPAMPGAVFWFHKNGTMEPRIDLPYGDSAFSVVYDNRDAVLYYDLVVAAQNGTTKWLYLIDVDNDRPSGPRVKLLGAAPSTDFLRDDIAISPGGALIYPNGILGKVYSINLTTGVATELGTVKQARSIAFLSRNSLASLDTGLAVGSFAGQTGPTGKPGLKVTVTDPEFSSGLVQIEVSGSNLVVYDKGVAKSLPYWFRFDPRHEITRFSFIAEKINASSSASIRVIAHDAAGLCGDPPVEMMVTAKKIPDTVTIDLTEVPPIHPDRRVVMITNSGVSQFTLIMYGGTLPESYKLNGDPKTASDQTLDIVGKRNTIKIPLHGTITLLCRMGNTLTIVAQSTDQDGGQAMIAVN